MPFRPAVTKRNLKSKQWRTLREIVLLEENTCGRCGAEVDTGLSGMLPHGPTVGHIISVRERPDLELVRNNLQLEHRKCNMAAGS